MFSYIARRLVLMIPTLIGITFVVFMLLALSPGGIGASLRVSGGQMEASKAAQLEAYLEDRYGLNDPVVYQYAKWLGRICPVKFGTRDQVTPSGELIRPPKSLVTPWMKESLYPDLENPEARKNEPIDTGSLDTDEKKARAYRTAARDYAKARADYIVATKELKHAYARYAKATGIEGAVDDDGNPRESRIPGVTIDAAAPSWKPVQAAAYKVLETYEIAEVARDRLSTIFGIKPFDEVGVPVLPGLVSLASPDLGTAFSRGRPVSDLIADALPVTLLLNLVTIPIIYLIAIPSGMLAAARQGTLFDVLSGATYVAMWSIPRVWAGVLLIGYLANNQYLGWFPVSGLHDSDAASFAFLPTWTDGEFHRGYLLDTLWHICLPVACFVYSGFAVLSKQTRAAMLDNFNADYVRTARAKGVRNIDVVFKHVFRNSLLPLITMFVTIFPFLLAGSVVIEKIFSIPGMGSLVLEAINLRDRELLLANTIIIAVINLLALLLADILYALADPRVTYD